MFRIQHSNSNRDRRTLSIYFFLCIKLCRKDWSKFKSITSASAIFLHLSELSYSVHQGINPPTPSQKHIYPFFWPRPLQIFQAPLFKQFSSNYIKAAHPLPFWKKSPLLFWKPPSRNWDPVKPNFWKFGRRLNLQEKDGCTLCK